MDKKKSSFKEEMSKLNEELEQEEIKEQELAKESEKEVEEDEKEKKVTIYDILEKESNLSKEQIDEWKDRYGSIYMTRFEEGDNIIYRYVTLPEFKAMTKQVQNITTGNPDDVLDNLLFTKCVLYPTLDTDKKAIMKAGTISTVALQIKISSNFLPDALAVDMIQRL